MTTYKLFKANKLFFIFLLVIPNTIINAQDEISFRTNKGIPILKLELNGKHAYFVLDTGASSSLIDNSVKKHYGFTTRNVNNAFSNDTVLGIGGIKELEQAYNVLLTIKGKKIKPIDFKSTNLSILRGSLNVVGIIGSDFLIEHGYSIDFERNVLVRIIPQLDEDKLKTCM
ncbi:MAG: aspartyl protease family protein [Psychroserpens sp.]|uniref:aspartyl protease family protein n=1 Tax=Psychroserpens sp. TaxID=2020870 RepID=UPI0030010C80